MFKLLKSVDMVNHYNYKFVFFIASLFIIFVSCLPGDKNKAGSVFVESDSDVEAETFDTLSFDESVDTAFQFLGEAVGREENFDDTVHIVTKEKISDLYRSYNVSELNDKYSLIRSKQIYIGSRFLSRIIRFDGEKQDAAITFYDYSLNDFCEIGDRVIVSLNSLAYSSSDYPSSFKCKIVLLSSDLVPLKGDMIGYSDEEFTYVDTLFVTPDNKVHATVINSGFDIDYYYEHKLTYSSKLEKLSDSVKKLDYEQQSADSSD